MTRATTIEGNTISQAGTIALRWDLNYFDVDRSQLIAGLSGGTHTDAIRIHLDPDRGRSSRLPGSSSDGFRTGGFRRTFSVADEGQDRQNCAYEHGAARIAAFAEGLNELGLRGLCGQPRDRAEKHAERFLLGTDPAPCWTEPHSNPALPAPALALEEIVSPRRPAFL